MYYEINISILRGDKYVHLFATSKRSLTTKSEMLALLNLFVYKFPKSEGYKIDVTYYEEVGDILNVDDLLKELE